jgi:hypothetical protein
MKAAELIATMAQLAEKATPFVPVTVTSVRDARARLASPKRNRGLEGR